MLIETGQHQPKRYELCPAACPRAYRSETFRESRESSTGRLATLVTRPKMLSKDRISGSERKGLQRLVVYAWGITVKPSIELSHSVDKGGRPFAVKGAGYQREGVLPTKGGRPQIEKRCALVLNLVKVEFQETVTAGSYGFLHPNYLTE